MNRNLRLLWTILASLQPLPLAVNISQTSWIMDLRYLICIKFLEIPLAMTLLDLKKFWAFCTTGVYDLGAFDVYLCFWTPFAPSSIQGIQWVTALEQILIFVHQNMSLIVLTLMLHKFLLKIWRVQNQQKTCIDHNSALILQLECACICNTAMHLSIEWFPYIITWFFPLYFIF